HQFCLSYCRCRGYRRFRKGDLPAWWEPGPVHYHWSSVTSHYQDRLVTGFSLLDCASHREVASSPGHHLGRFVICSAGTVRDICVWKPAARISILGDVLGAHSPHTVRSFPPGRGRGLAWRLC